MPEWNLNDLYPGLDSPEIKHDLELADDECLAFEQAFTGRRAELAAGDDANAGLAAVKRYEALDDTLGRVMSYASLLYAGDNTDPVRAKFYGDMQERITAASLHLLFFTLELNRIDDAALDAAMADPRARPLPAVDRGRAQGEAVSTRGSGRAAFPREVGHRLFGLEPAI